MSARVCVFRFKHDEVGLAELELQARQAMVTVPKLKEAECQRLIMQAARVAMQKKLVGRDT